jgi:hypothetical protein
VTRQGPCRRVGTENLNQALNVVLSEAGLGENVAVATRTHGRRRMTRSATPLVLEQRPANSTLPWSSDAERCPSTLDLRQIRSMDPPLWATACTLLGVGRRVVGPQLRGVTMLSRQGLLGFIYPPIRRTVSSGLLRCLQPRSGRTI